MGSRRAYAANFHNQRLSTSFDGADVFLRLRQEDGITDVFDLADKMIESLESGKMEDVHLDRMNIAVEHFSYSKQLGSEMNRAEMQRGVNDKRLLLMNEDISNLEDADLAKLVTDLQAKLVSRNAAQQAFVKIAQDSLFNYIR